MRGLPGAVTGVNFACECVPVHAGALAPWEVRR
jgi:hypothetical protein